MNDILLTICARGGSKGLKNKNIKELNGKPLIGYTIEQAIKWGKAEHVVVSTDSDIIADISKQFGAEIPFMRPAELATDNSGKIPVIRHALKICENIYQREFPIVVDLDPSAPIRTVDDIDNAMELFSKTKPSTLFSVVNSKKNPYFNMVEEYPDGKIGICKKFDKELVARQHAPIVYSLNASIYIYDRLFLTNELNNSCITSDSIIYEMDENSSVDIDHEIDFKFIEYLLKEGKIKI